MAAVPGMSMAMNPYLILILAVVALVCIVALGIMGVIVAAFIDVFIPFILIALIFLILFKKIPLPAPWSYVVCLGLGAGVYYLLFM